MARRQQLRPALNMTVSQRLAMTPSLLQKIELLTLSRLELSELLNQELVENPVLEEANDANDPELGERTEQETIPERPADKEPTVEEKDTFEDFDYEYFFGEYLAPSQTSREFESSDDRPSFESFLVRPTSLMDHLNWQLGLLEVPPEIHEIAYFIIGNLDEDGFLTLSLEEISNSLSVPLERVEEALKVVQGMDPAGVGSRSLQECLLIQIRAAGQGGTLLEKLVQDYLPLIEVRKFKEIARELQCEMEDISAALEDLRQFSPKPGEKHSSKTPVYIEPDVYIYKVGNDYEILMNEDGLPKLRLNQSYRDLLKANNVTRDTKSFIKERFRSALELLKSIDQRKQTIYRVCLAVVERQKEFLEKGLMYLKPMLIKDVAEELGVHSSTISRVVTNKYAYTPQGVIELRKFFTIGVESIQGENLSIVHVKEKIRKIIGEENPKKPLSDQKISRLLNLEGIQITRRTVAKYRDQMKIHGSRERKMAVLF
ncbi:MAG: RNA polymerase factor sigma-54 [Acidobacteria bacterium]|nr:RNA polymerase factor sigma-54 [Acidobacteriota bacterium]